MNFLKTSRAVFFTLIMIILSRGMVDAQPNLTKGNSVQDLADILKDNVHRLRQTVSWFKDKTGVEVYIVTSYDLNDQDIKKLTGRWVNKGHDAILITINPFEMYRKNAPNWLSNIEIKVSPKIKNAKYLTSDVITGIIQEKGMPELVGANINSKDQFYNALEKMLLALDFIIDPPPFKLDHVLIDNKSYKDGDVVVLCQGSEALEIIPVEAYHRGFPEEVSSGGSTQLVWEGSGFFDYDNRELGSYLITYTPSGATSGDEILISFREDEIKLTVRVVKVTLDDNLYILNEGRSNYTTIVNYDIVPEDMNVMFKTNDDPSFEKLISGKGTFELSPYDVTGAPMTAGRHNIIFAPQFGESSDLFCESEFEIDVIRKSRITDLTVEQIGDNGLNGRRAGTGDTLYLLKKNVQENKKAKLNIVTPATRFFMSEPILKCNNSFAINARSNGAFQGKGAGMYVKSSSGGKYVQRSKSSLINSSSIGTYHFTVDGFDDRKGVFVNIGNKTFTKHSNSISKLLFVKKAVDRIDDVLNQVPYSKKLFKRSAKLEYSTQRYQDELDLSSQLVWNEKKEVTASLSIKADDFVPGLSKSIDLWVVEVGFGVFMAAGIDGKVKGTYETFNHHHPASWNFDITGEVKGYIRFGLRLKGEFSIFGYGIAAQSDGYVEVSVIGKPYYLEERSVVRVNTELGRADLDFIIKLVAKTPTTTWELFSFSWEMRLMDGSKSNWDISVPNLFD